MNELDLNTLISLLETENITSLKAKLKKLSGSEVFKKLKTKIKVTSNEDVHSVNSDYLLGEINQILETKTIERSHYYLKRLIKSLTEIKTSNINDLNLNRWKEYDDIITDSLWILDKRDKSGAHKGNYWGNFIPQIPNQFLRRYTKKGDWILDTFAGSGTTLIECRRLERNCIGIELNEDVVKLAKENIAKEKTKNTSIVKVVKGNSAEIDIKAELKKETINSVQFVFMHPPYWDIIKFSKKKNDLSNAKSVAEFLKMFGAVLDNTVKFLEKGRYLAVVIGDKYSDGEWVPLGFYVMEEVKNHGLKLKSTIVKNFDTTKGKMNQKELWRYRALAGGFYIFKHEYIFLFQRPVK
ncbi:RsmD family RNA methyltransferase [bacterium BMS3Abin03]|nr:RsmD family RNA methyltransferase [bacterium BMS3Abin03]MCG6961245.1 RsmD family RNA methyltransferase [bacterium BMS3Abin03]